MHIRLALFTIIIVGSASACPQVATCAEPRVLANDDDNTCEVDFFECDNGKTYEIECEGDSCSCRTRENAALIETGTFGRDVSAEDPCDPDNDPAAIVGSKCGYYLSE